VEKDMTEIQRLSYQIGSMSKEIRGKDPNFVPPPRLTAEGDTPYGYGNIMPAVESELQKMMRQLGN
jgi:hypothetical protein